MKCLGLYVDNLIKERRAQKVFIEKCRELSTSSKQFILNVKDQNQIIAYAFILPKRLKTCHKTKILWENQFKPYFPKRDTCY